jgi:cytochrome c oxidase cbb3-type subunit 4
MSLDFGTLVWISQSVGLLCLVALSLAVLLYVCWPSNRKRFDGAAKSILGDEDNPWQ